MDDMIGIMVRDAGYNGGCKVVSDRLFECFCVNGYQAVLISLYHTENDKYVSIGVNKKKRLNSSDIQKIAACIRERGISQLIIQVDAPLSSVFYPKLLKKLHSCCKIYCVLHNSTASYFKTYRSYKVLTMDSVLKIINGRMINIAASRTRMIQNAEYARFVTLTRASQKDLEKYTGCSSAVIENCPPSIAGAGIEDKEDICVYIGRIDSYQKNIYLLLEAWKKTDVPPGWKLCVIGSGREYGSIRSYIKKHAIQNIDVISELPVQEVMGYLKRSKVLLLTSNYEGLPTVAVEAMGMGNAIVSTRYDGIDKALLEDGYNCLLADHDAAGYAADIYRIMTDQVLWKRLVQNGFQVYEKIQGTDIIHKWKREFTEC